MVGLMQYGWYIEDEEVATLETASGSNEFAELVVTYVVFWLEAGVPKAAQVIGLTAMLAEAERLRKAQRAGEPITHVTSVVDGLGVGHPGVDVTGPDYDWKKRRP